MAKSATLLVSFLTALGDDSASQGELLLLFRPLNSSNTERGPLTICALAKQPPPPDKKPEKPLPTADELAKQSIAAATRLLTKDDVRLVCARASRSRTRRT